MTNKSNMEVHMLKEDAASEARIEHIRKTYGDNETSLAAAFDTIHQACQLGIYKMRESEGTNKGSGDALHASKGVAKALEFIFRLAGTQLEADPDKCMEAVKAFRKLKDDLRAELFGDDDPDRPAAKGDVNAANKAVDEILAKAGTVAKAVPPTFTYQNRGDS